MTQHQPKQGSGGKAEKLKQADNTADNNRPLSTEEIMDYVRFCFRTDIIKQLKHAKQPHVVGTALYKKETGKDFPISASRRHLSRWMLMNGQLLPKH